MPLFLLVALFGGCCAFAQNAAAILTSSPSPAPLGQMITWQAEPSGGANLRYRFRVRAPGTPSPRRRDGSPTGFRIIRDYSPESSLEWTPIEREGVYEMEASIQDLATGAVTTATQLFEFVPRAAGQSVVNPTRHPLVFLFSAPPCAPGARMRVRFETASEPPQYTPYQDCEPALTRNFYLAGLRARTSYTAVAETGAGSGIETGNTVAFEAGSLPASLSWGQTPVAPAPPDSVQRVLLGTSGGSQIATDLEGRIVWFNLVPLTWATRPQAGGYLWGVMEDFEQPVAYQRLRQLDLIGMTVLETNAERVSQQLEAMGRRPITGFHHEVRPLPDGRILALAGVEQMLTDVQGPGDKAVLGDTIVVLDRQLNVVWSWDSFDFLDASRQATTGAVCTRSSNGCPAFYLAPEINDWTHGNAVQLTPDGHLLFSSRHQDWLIKIDYANGAGSGHVLWRLGRGGDFTFVSDDPFPWFSHQHDGNFESGDPARLIVFDNGNIRLDELGGAVNSRGQVIELDEAARSAALVLNVDLGVFSPAVGSAQRLENGNYFFNAGFVFGPGATSAHQVEVDPKGNVVSRIVANTGLYRSFRMRDMYSATE